MTIPLSLFRGDSVFTSFRTLGVKPLALDFHLNRLYENTNQTYLRGRVSKKEFLNYFSRLDLNYTDYPDHYFRFTIYPVGQSFDIGISELELDISIKKIEPSFATLKLDLMLSPYSGAYARMKGGSYFMEFNLKRQALKCGYDDVLFYRDNFITEATTATLLLRKGSQFIIVSNQGNLDSATAEQFSHFRAVEFKKVQISQLEEFDSAYLLNSVQLISSVSQISDHYFKVDQDLKGEFINFLKADIVNE